MNKKILKKIKDDVETVKKISKILITIDGENNVSWQLTGNLEKGIGGVIAVIGPAENFKETLLLEIGTGRSRPYTETIYPGYFVSYRKKFFEISICQYNIVAPYIFKAIQLITDLRIAKWEGLLRGDPFRIKYNNHWYTKRNGFNSWEVSVETIPAIRFAFAKKDEFIINDMLYLFCHSEWTRKKMTGLGNYIDKALSGHRKKRRVFKRFERLKNVAGVKKSLEKWPCFLIKEMLLKYLPEGNKNLFFYELAELIGWDGITFSEEKEKMLASFLGVYKKETISEFGNKINYVREDDKIIFFDVCPSNYNPTKK